ncbi:hypothetical protein BN1708_016538, partial [Verticillium longisporum]
PVSKTIEPEPAQPRPRHSHSFHLATASPGQSSAISSINNKLRRRNSHGSPSNTLPLPLPPKIGPQRSTKNAQKLKLLPNPEPGEEDEESGRDVYSQYTRIKDPTARRDAARLGKADRERLPRVTAYSTANKYEMEGLMRFMKGRGKSRGANPKLIDECLYSALEQSRVVKGMVFPKQPDGTIKKVKRAKVGVFSCPIDTSQTETKGTVLLHNAKEMMDFTKGEENQLEAAIKELHDVGLRVVIAGSTVGDLAQHYLNKYGILFIKILS